MSRRAAEGIALRYFILRNGEQYGPYSRAEVQRYLRTGDIFPGDLGRSDAMNQWLPISQVIGAGAPPVPSPAGIADSARDGRLPPHTFVSTTEPPRLHWGIVLLLTTLTFGLFAWIWSVVLAIWVRKIDPRNPATLLLVMALATSMMGVATFFIVPSNNHQQTLAALLQCAAVALFEIAIFRLRRAVMQFAASQGVTLSLNWAATFIFSVIYFEFHFNRLQHAQCTAPWMPLHHS